MACNPDIRRKISTKALKVRDLALNSVFKRSIASLDALLTDKLRGLYDGRGSNYEQRYAGEVFEYLKSRRHLVEFLNFVATIGRWNNLVAINYIRRH